MKMIRHIIETLGLIAIIAIMAFLPTDRYQNLSLLFCAVGCISILLFLAIYLFKNHKKELFIFLFLLLGLSHNAMAGYTFRDDNVLDETAASYTNKIRQIGPQICSTNDNFDEESKNPVPLNLLSDACEITTMYGKLGIGDTDWWRDWTIGTGTSLDDYKDCAKELIKKNANWYKEKENVALLMVPDLIRQERGKCWPCGIVDIFLESVEKICFGVHDYMTNIALILLGFMTLFWLLFRVLTFLGKMGTGGQDELMSDILKRLFVVLCTAAVLNAPIIEFTNIVISPFIQLGTHISNKITEVPITNNPSLINELGLTVATSCSCCSNPSSTCDDAGSGESKTQKSTYRLITETERAALLCATCRIYKQTLPFSASGQALVRYSFKNKNVVSKFTSKISGGATDYIPVPLTMYILGIVLIIVFTLLAFLATFKLIDIFMRLGFVFILLPLLIAAYAFPISRDYTKSAWEFLIHAILSFISLSIGVALLMLLFTSFLPGNAQNMLVPAILGR